MALTEEAKKEIELEVRRRVSESEASHTEFLAIQLGHLKWFILAIFTIASGILVFFVGKSYNEVQATVKGQVEDRIINFEIDESLKANLQGRIDSLVKANSTTTKIESAIIERVDGILDDNARSKAEEALADRLAEFKDLTDDQVKSLVAAVPVGTILAFGGDRPPTGWRLCDGTSLPLEGYPELYRVIGSAFGGETGVTFNLPDLRGRFLRGVDGGAGHDPDAASRTTSNPGGAVGDKVGSLQGDSTKRPNQPFTTNSAGIHNHDFPIGLADPGREMPADGMNEGGRATTSNAGEHIHTILGGDAETRPVNVGVNWIIKVAFHAGDKADQDSAGQPATVGESD